MGTGVLLGGAGSASLTPEPESHPAAALMQRMCVGCRGKAHRSSLLRIVVDAKGTLVLDAAKSMPGRGAWLHPNADCLTKATSRRVWGRALKWQSAVRTEDLHNALALRLSAASPSGDKGSQTAASHDHDRKRV